MKMGLIILLLCLSLRESMSQATCTVKLYQRPLQRALRLISLGSFSEPDSNTTQGIDGLFTALRSGDPVELVILIDNSLEVRPNHFYLLNKPMVENLLKYHVNSAAVSVSIIQFGEAVVSVLCKEVTANCPMLEQCIMGAQYNATQNSGWVGMSMAKGLDEAYNILNQTTKANRKKIIFIVSGFQITNFYLQKVMARKDNLTAMGVDIYPMLSSFRSSMVEAAQLATTPDKFMNQSLLLTKLFSTIPLGGPSCGGNVASSGQSSPGQICKVTANSEELCICKLGYSGPGCATAPTHCSFPSACPPGSTCAMVKENEYRCSCPFCNTAQVCMNFIPAVLPPVAPPVGAPGGPQGGTPVGPPVQPSNPLNPAVNEVSPPPAVAPPRQNPQPVPDRPRDRPTPPRDLPLPQTPQNLPSALSPDIQSPQPTLPPLDTLLSYITTLIERAKQCLYPPGSTDQVNRAN